MEPFDIDSDALQARVQHLHRRAQVGDCVGGVAHDINNMLGAAMAYAELVAYDEGVSDDSKRMLGQIVDGISKCSGLISSLTSISRKERLDVSLASPENLMDEALILRDYEFKIRQITVERDYHPGVATISTDLAKLKLALIYLLVNAQEALQDAPEKIVRIRVANVEGGVCFDVWDSGPGLAPDAVEKAFAPYYSTAPDGDRLGLGLSNARAVAELHDGSLTYTPENGFRLVVKHDNQLRAQL